MRQQNRQRPFGDQRVSNVSSFPVREPATLLDFLFSVMSDKSKTTVKSYLAHRQVAVNGRPITQFDAPLYAGDEVFINFEKGFKPFKNNSLSIVYEDEYLIVINKAYGLLSMGTEREKEKTAYRMLSEYVKTSDPRNRIFILHRLDKDTSGIMMFAKNADIQAELQNNWNMAVRERKYVAVIDGVPEQLEGEVSSYLNENSAFNVYSTTEDSGRFALTRYKVLRSNERYSLVELDLETGRKNQIRVHMQEIGHSVVGDRKYGGSSSPIGRMALHAFKLKFVHPVGGRELVFQTPVPAKFLSLVKK